MTGKSGKIFVVDDEKRNHLIMDEILSDNYDVYPAYTGDEALQKLDEIDPDIILLDIMMPGKDGYKICEEIKKKDNRNDVPVVFVSAKDTLEDRLKGYSVGAADYFVKPFDHDELLIKVKNLITYKDKTTNAKKEYKSARDVAFQAMTNVSDLGCILRFMQHSFTSSNYDEIAQQLFNVMENFGLKTSVQIRDNDDIFTISDDGDSSPLEASVLSKSKERERIIDFKDKTIFTYDHVSLIVKNMPLDDEHRYGTIKDNICYLLDCIEARVNSLISENEIRKQRTHLISIIKLVNKRMESLNDEMHDIRVKGAAIVEDMIDEMEKLLPTLLLAETQEMAIFKITEEGVNNTKKLFDESLRVDEKFVALFKQLSEISCSVDYIDKLEKILSNTQ